MSHRTHIMITRQGWYYVAMLGFITAGAIIRDINLLYIMAGMMLGPLLLSFLRCTQVLRRLRFQRRFARLVSVGDPLIVDVIAQKEGHGGGSHGIAAEDQIARDGFDRRSPRTSAKLFYSHVPRAGQVEASYSVRLHRRGRYRLGPLKISTSMPLGLIRATHTRIDQDHVLVSPRIGQLLPEWSRRLQMSHEGGQKSIRRRGKAEGEFYAMRNWRTGDSRSWIHWRTSAKRNTLSVRQFEHRTSQDLAIVLDLWQGAMGPLPSREVEAAVSFVATLVVQHGRQGSARLLVASASRHGMFLSGVSSPVFRQELMEKLAVVEPTGEDRLPVVLEEILPRVSANSKIVIVSTRAVNVHDTDRFAAIWSRPSLRRMIGEIVTVDASSEAFGLWFQEHDQRSPIPETTGPAAGGPAAAVSPREVARP